VKAFAKLESRLARALPINVIDAFHASNRKRCRPCSLERDSSSRAAPMSSFRREQMVSPHSGGDREGQYSIRLNDQFRVCFVWTEGRGRG